jgi:hypothetical protein
MATTRPAPSSGTLTRLAAFIEHPRVQGAIIALILLNAALLGMETWPAAMAAAGGLILGIDQVILGVFVVEIVLRLYIHRGAFWRDPWSVFDFTVVAIALLPATGPLAVLRGIARLASVAPADHGALHAAGSRGAAGGDSGVGIDRHGVDDHLLRVRRHCH